MNDFTLFEALTGGAFDRLNWQHSGEFDQNFSQKSNAPVFARWVWAVLERLAFKGMIMILEDLIVTYKASVVFISDASTSASNTRKLSSGLGSF